VGVPPSGAFRADLPVPEAPRGRSA